MYYRDIVCFIVILLLLSEDSLSDVDDDFDHMIGLSPRSSTGGSYGNLKDPTNQYTPATSTPEGHINCAAQGQGQSVDNEEVFVKDVDDYARDFKSQLLKRSVNGSTLKTHVNNHNFGVHTNTMASSLTNGDRSPFDNNINGNNSNGLSQIGGSPKSSMPQPLDNHNGDVSDREADLDLLKSRHPNGVVSEAYDDCDGDDEEEEEDGKENPNMAVQLCQVDIIIIHKVVFPRISKKAYFPRGIP